MATRKKKAAPRRARKKSAAKRKQRAPRGETGPRLFRVALEVGALEEASRNYAQLFDTPGRRIVRGGGRHYFDLGDQILALLDVSSQRTPQPSGSDVYLRVTDLAPYHSRAAALGWLSTEEVHGAAAGDVATRPWGERSFYVADPWGNGLCFVQAGTEFTGR